ncbi:MAG: hypothetical protein JRH01_24665 [Deltaproteobacteria bacterium]|nr:hypothetical protein [Deltaproteobacteria bacterium]
MLHAAKSLPWGSIALAILLASAFATAEPSGNSPPAQDLRSDPRFQEVIDFGALDLPRLQAVIFGVTNEVRARHGKKSVRRNALLEIAASGHASRMVEGGFFSHRDPEPELETLAMRVALAGVANGKPAENIATAFAIRYEHGKRVFVIDKERGLFSLTRGGEPIAFHTYLSFADALLAQWMDSPGHRANILSDNAVELGCGAAPYRKDGFPKFMAVQVFQFFAPVQELSGT